MTKKGGDGWRGGKVKEKKRRCRETGLVDPFDDHKDIEKGNNHHV